MLNACIWLLMCISVLLNTFSSSLSITLKCLMLTDTTCPLTLPPECENVYSQPTIHRNAYDEVITGIMLQGNWHQVLIISDGFDFQFPNIRMTILSCDTTFHLSESLRYSLSHTSEYVNLLINCSYNDTRKVMDRIAMFHKRDQVNLNMLFLNLSLASYEYLLKPNLRDGDNLVIVSQADKEDIISHDMVRELCLYSCATDCYKYETRLKRVGTFNVRDDVLKLGTILLPSKFQGFDGRELIVAFQNDKPFTYFSKTDPNSVVGLEVEIVKALSEKFNFRYTYVQPEEYVWGTRINSTYWNGMIGLVMRGEADLAGSSMTVGMAREEVIDFLYPHWESTSVIAITLDKNKWRYFISIFSQDLWLAILAMPFAMGLVVILWQTVQVKITHKTSGVDQNTDKIITWRYFNRVFGLMGMLVLQGSSVPGLRGSLKLVLAFYWLTTIILAAVYSGNLTAALAVSSVQLPFSTLHELAADREYIFIVQKGTYKEQLFRDAKSGVYKKLWEKIQLNPQESLVSDTQEALDKGLNNQGTNKYAYTSGKLYMTELIRQHNACHMTVLKEEYLKGGTALVVKQGMPYWEAFSKTVMQLRQAGLVERWMCQHVSRDHCSIRKGAQQQPTTLEDLTYLWLLLVAPGMILASFCLIVEITGAYFRLDLDSACL